MRYIGKEIAKVDAEEKVKGIAQYQGRNPRQADEEFPSPVVFDGERREQRLADSHRKLRGRAVPQHAQHKPGNGIFRLVGSLVKIVVRRFWNGSDGNQLHLRQHRIVGWLEPVASA